MVLCITIIILLSGCGSKDNDSEEATTCISKVIAPARVNYPVNRNSDIPKEYLEKCDRSGQILHDYYDGNYYGNGKPYLKYVTLYCPYGYDEEDTSKKYNILYLVTSENENEDSFTPKGQESILRNLLDNMIAKGDIEPCIICIVPYQNVYTEGIDCAKLFYKEFKDRVIPIVESDFNTYYVRSSKTGIIDSRFHRAIAGYSLGGIATWSVFTNALDTTGYFMPISTSCNVNTILTSIKKQQYQAESYKIFAGNGGSSDDSAPSLATQLENMSKNELFVETDNFASGNLYNCNCNTGKTQETLYKVIYNGLRTFFDN